jgi:hypothetical protein
MQQLIYLKAKYVENKLTTHMSRRYTLTKRLHEKRHTILVNVGICLIALR